MKKKGLSMNLIMALTLTAVAVSVLLCANLVFMQTYRQTLLRLIDVCRFVSSRPAAP